jgi:uncharacterized protein (UPF0276 family)
MKANVGIGFRRDFAEELLHSVVLSPSFIELAPENWIGMGGYWGKVLRQATERFSVTCHGLSLSIGSPEPLDWEFIKKVKTFLDEHNVQVYSEHLSYTKCNNAHLYDLLPIPFREDAVRHVAQRIREVQDFLERKIAIENVSYYTPIAAEMEEHTFVSSILEEADCNLLLDVNNVYVNSFNHKYDAKSYIERLPLNRVAYIHMAGHEKVSEDLIIDTHGHAIIDPVYELFDWAVERINPVPILLERDFNFPEMEELQEELSALQKICTKKWKTAYAVKS